MVEKQEKALKEIDWSGEAEVDLINANREEVLKMYLEAIRRIQGALVGPVKGYRGSEGKLDYIQAIVRAVGNFHPMHTESWCGWPE